MSLNESSNVKVSVIVPIYNTEKYLSKCLESLIGQTLKEIEIFAVNDGSTDGSLSIAKQFAAKDSRVIVLDKPNGGMSDARNFAFPHVRGEFVGFVDSDDFVDADMFETMYNKALETVADVVECNLHHTFDDFEDTEIVDQITDKNDLIMNGRNVVWNKIYNYSWLKSTGVMFPSGLIYEDVSFCVKIIPFINKLSYVEQPFYHYVQRSISTNNYQTLKTLQILDILDDVYSFYETNGFLNDYRDALEFLYTRILLCSSFSRMTRIPDAHDRSVALPKNWEKLISTFPEWKKGKYLREYTGKHSMFMKSMNSFTYKLAGFLLPIYYKIK